MSHQNDCSFRMRRPAKQGAITSEYLKAEAGRIGGLEEEGLPTNEWCCGARAKAALEGGGGGRVLHSGREGF